MPLTPEVVAARPRIVDVAVGLMLTAAVCTLVFAVMLPFQVPGIVAREAGTATSRGLTVAQLQSALTGFAIAEVCIAVTFVAALVWTALRLRRGRKRFRVVLIVLTVLAVVPANIQALLVAALLVVADVLVFRRSASAWIGEAEAARAHARATSRI